MIEGLWSSLQGGPGGASQTRIDATHPLDLYADFQPPDRVGLVAICASRPPAVRPMRALTVEQARRADGRWTVRLSLVERPLLPVFAALCRDIITCTRSGVDERALGTTVVQRLVHWRSLLERDSSGLGEPILRGLIGELTVLEQRVLPVLPPQQAVGSWTGPRGTAQDFLLPGGRRIEVKALASSADEVRINGLEQLDPGEDALSLTVVRMDVTGEGAPGAVTATSLVAGLRERLSGDPEALAGLNANLDCLGWHEHPTHDAFMVRVTAIEDHEVGAGFPRLIRANVPHGVLDADYIIALPGRSRDDRGAGH